MTPRDPSPIDWEAFYHGYRKPGYVPGFEILHKIGGGAFGIVFRARKESIGKDYAIKFFKVDDETVRDTFLRELGSVRHFAQLDHPNLVSIEDQGEVDGIPYIVMGYAGDRTLRTLLEDGSLTRTQALSIFGQVARGVAALHDHSIVHFDLKPSNIFLNGDLVRVGDYGLARLVTQSRNSLTFGRGTPYYMAPEVLHRRGDQRSDIYSLGVLLYECLAGDVPFHGDSEWEVLRKHETEQPEIPRRLAANERAVIDRCLQKDPADRFESVDELIEALEPAPTAPVTPPTAHAIGVAKTNRAPMLAAAAVLLVLVGAVASLFTVRDRYPAPRPSMSVHAMSTTRDPVRGLRETRLAMQRARAEQTWEQRLTKLATRELGRLARAAADAHVSPGLRRALEQAGKSLRRDLERGNVRGLATTLDRIGQLLEGLLRDLDRRICQTWPEDECR